MQKLPELQSEFMNYLRDEPSSIEQQIDESGVVNAATRLAIYKNAYRSRLREVIDQDYPVLGIYLGDTLFEQLVQEYIRQHPSRYASLRDFGENLPAFLASSKSFSSIQVLSELAAFERSLMFAFDAADAERTSMVQLQRLSVEQWPHMQLRFHPSVQLFFTTWNCVEIWQALKGKQAPPEAQSHPGVGWIIWRNAQQLSQFRSLEGGEYAMLKAFLNGATFAQVCEELISWYPVERLSAAAVQHLKEWVENGLVCEIVPAGEGSHLQGVD